MAKTVDEMKAWIDAADYKELLRKNRYAPIGSPWFVGEVGAYCAKAMTRKRGEMSHGERVAASKAIGWGD